MQVLCQVYNIKCVRLKTSPTSETTTNYSNILKLSNMSEEAERIKVIARFRPQNETELQRKQEEVSDS